MSPKSTPRDQAGSHPPFLSRPLGMHVNHAWDLLGGPPRSQPEANIGLSAGVVSTLTQIADECDAPIHPPQCFRSLRNNNIADLLDGLPPAPYGHGTKFLETDSDNPAPWSVTDAVYERNHTTDLPLKEERQRILAKYHPVLPPQSTYHIDFARRRPEGDPKPGSLQHLHRNGPRWTKTEYRAFLNEAMMIQFPPNTKGVVETRTWGDTWSDAKTKDLKGLQPELDAAVAASTLKTSRYEEFHIEWSELQGLLTRRADALRAEYVGLVEEIGCLHYKFVRNHVGKEEYKPARECLVEQMDDIFAEIGMVAHTLGTLFAVARAVAQGVLSPGGFDYGKLDVAACNAVPYLRSVFPEFIRKKDPTNPIPADPMAPEPSMCPFKSDLPSYDFHDIMASVWQRHPTKLQDAHKAVLKNGFEGLEELTLKDKENVQALLGNGGQWRI